MAEFDKRRNALVKNTSSEKQVNRAADKEESRRQRELNDIATIMATVEGRRFIYRCINELCHYDMDDFNNSGSITFHSLGERNIGRIIKSDCLEASIERYQEAEQENWKFLQNEGV